jgi:hypothetical protein
MRTPKVSIFIRTYAGDVEWLGYCLRSIHLNLSGWCEVVVCLPQGQEALIRPLLSVERLVTCRPFDDDYIGQQVSKLQAHRHVSGDYVLFVDSDVVFRPGSRTSDYFSEGLPVIVKERYDELSFPAARCWRPVVTKLFGATPEWEYMRNGGVMLFRKDTLEMFGDDFPAIESYARIQPYRTFTEFNFLGFFAERNQAQAYVFIDRNRAPAPPQGHVCFWSWGGIDKAIEFEMENMGLRPVGLTLGNRLFRAAKWLGLISVWRLIKPPKRYF